MAPRKPKAEVFSNRLLEQVKFIINAQRSRGDEASTHCLVRYGYIVAFDRMLAAGAPIAEDDLCCCPQTDRLRLALEHCGAEYQIVQHEDSLFVRSGEFQAYVPLCNPAKLSVPVPDAPVAPLSDTFKAAVAIVGGLVKDSAPTLLQSCVQLNAGSCVATNGSVIMEAWHGCDMPPGLLISKAFCDALVKTGKKLVSFGFSKDTFTAHFEDRCWLRTNLYQEKVPDMLAKLVEAKCIFPVPAGFFSQTSEVSRWSEDGKVYVDNDVIHSHHPSKRNNVGCYQSFPMPGLKQGISYSSSALKLIAKHATQFDDAHKGVTMFYGDRLRGAIAHEVVLEIKPPKCHRCGSALNGDGICQNYGCEHIKGESMPERDCMTCGLPMTLCDCIPF